MLTAGAPHHVAVLVSDLARAEEFYAGVLGLPVVARHPDERGAPRSVWLGLGGGPAFLALERATEGVAPRSEGAPGWHCVALTIEAEERAAWLRGLAARGIEVVRRTRFTIYARDPDGSLVGLSHYPTAVDD